MGFLALGGRPRPAPAWPALSRAPNCPGCGLLSSTTNLIRPTCRHKAVPLVCRRWRQLVNSHPLLSSVALALSGLPRLRSFCEWVLLRASQHVTHLDLTLGRLLGDEAGEPTGLLAAAVAACGAGGSLAELRLKFSSESYDQTFECTTWIAALRSLRRLTIAVEGDLNVMVSLQPLTALQLLTLDGYILHLPPEARLPPSLTQLRLAGQNISGSLPGQVCTPACVHACMRGAVESGCPCLLAHS